MVNLQRRRRTPQTPIRRVALAAVPLLVVGLAACGDMTPPKDAVTAPPTLTDSATADASTPPGASDVSAVIGGWAATYGAARNEVTTSLQSLGSAAGAGPDQVKAAAKAAKAALTNAAAVPTCPDPTTETAYRSAVTELTRQAAAVAQSGDPAAAQQLADQATQAFAPTEEALRAVYS